LTAAASDLEEFRVKREEIFEFAVRPKVTRQGDKVRIACTAKGFCDVTVAIEDARGRIVRHLAIAVRNGRIALVHRRLNRLYKDGSTGGLELTGPKTCHHMELRLDGIRRRHWWVSPTSAADRPAQDPDASAGLASGRGRRRQTQP